MPSYLTESAGTGPQDLSELFPETPSVSLEEVLSIDWQISGKRVIADLARDLSVAASDLEDPYRLQSILAYAPALCAYYGFLAAQAQEELEYRKMEFDLWYAETASTVKLELVAQYGKSTVTDTAVRNAVIARTARVYAQFQDKIFTATSLAAKCRAVYQATKDRISVLQSISKAQIALWEKTR